MRLAVLFLLALSTAQAQQPLQQQLRQIAADAHGKVAIACALPALASPLDCNLDALAHPPMQSVFKLPLALTVLHQVEQGKFSLDQPVRFRKSDRIPPENHSPLQDKYPAADVDVPLRTLLQMTVALSDNTAADILLRIAGGPGAVNRYLASLNVHGFQLLDDESALHRDTRLQYRNWFAPQGAVQLLRRLSDRSPLLAEHTQLLLAWMRFSVNGTRLAGDLPRGTLVAHRTGTSGTEQGVSAATNDIGLIRLPDGRELAVAVFITDSTAEDAMRDKVIARIARATYEACLQRK